MQLFGFIEDTRSTGESITTTWGIPAQSERLSIRQAKVNERIKRGGGAEVTSVEEGESGDLPGQTIYFVTTEAER